MSAFMQVAEVWSPQRGEMRLLSGAYGEYRSFAQVSARTAFAFGEGLPGSVWSSNKPQVWQDLQDDDFVRLAEARGADLDAGLGIPISAGGRSEPSAVVVLLCGDGAHTGGAIERWDLDEQKRELRHAGGYYGNLREFERVSARLRFPFGHGLPGMVAQTGLPTVIADTRKSSSFVRAEAACESGVEAAVGIPLYRHGRVEHVVALLSTESTPLAKAFEVWVPTRSNRLWLAQSFYASGLERFAEASRGAEYGEGQGLPGKVLRTELPQVFSFLEGSKFVRSDVAWEVGLKTGIGIPVHDGRHVVAVVVLLS